jgi:hypothetical protein
MIAPVTPRDDRGGLDYLGPEFLTWLWWRADADPRFACPDGTELYVHVDEHLEFQGERAASRKTVLRAGLPGASMDARAALKSGKLVVAARLLFARGEDEVRFTLRAVDMDVSGVRLPAVREGGARERLETALENLEQFWDDLDLCFRTFLEARTGPSWPAQIERIRSWGAARSPDSNFA